MFQVSVPNVSFIFQTYVVSMFIWMFHIFHTYVASVLSGCCICLQLYFKCFSCVFASISDACFECFGCFIRILQVFYLDVKIDRGCLKALVWFWLIDETLGTNLWL